MKREEKAAIVCCSNGRRRSEEGKIQELERVLRKILPEEYIQYEMADETEESGSEFLFSEKQEEESDPPFFRRV